MDATFCRVGTDPSFGGMTTLKQQKFIANGPKRAPNMVQKELLMHFL